MFSLEDYNYDLPDRLIAQFPEDKRDRSKLLYLRRNSGKISHHLFNDIQTLIGQEDVLVVNNTEVIPGRLYGKKETGGNVELLILNYAEGLASLKDQGVFECSCLIKASKRPKTGTWIHFENDLKARVVHFKDGIFGVRFSSKTDFIETLYQIGQMPLPPYIKRNNNKADQDDRTTYQTVYASKRGAVAAPTAGLHFTSSLIKKLKLKGIKIVEITLHVGYGTFLPVRVSDIRKHQIHSEWFSISRSSADTINQVRSGGGRVVAVGTTSVRSLEYASDEQGNVRNGGGNCDLFIYPGYRFKTVDAMITNYHLPKSTLLMLVSAFAGRDLIDKAYREAINKNYRFYSYGDAMLIA